MKLNLLISYIYGGSETKSLNLLHLWLKLVVNKKVGWGKKLLEKSFIQSTIWLNFILPAWSFCFFILKFGLKIRDKKKVLFYFIFKKKNIHGLDRVMLVPDPENLISNHTCTQYLITMPGQVLAAQNLAIPMHGHSLLRQGPSLRYEISSFFYKNT